MDEHDLLQIEANSMETDASYSSTHRLHRSCLYDAMRIQYRNVDSTFPVVRRGASSAPRMDQDGALGPPTVNIFSDHCRRQEKAE